MDEEEFEEILLNDIDGIEDEGISIVSSFNDSGVLTSDRGLVVKMEDGSEFQVTIKKSK